MRQINTAKLCAISCNNLRSVQSLAIYSAFESCQNSTHWYTTAPLLLKSLCLFVVGNLYHSRLLQSQYSQRIIHAKPLPCQCSDDVFPGLDTDNSKVYYSLPMLGSVALRTFAFIGVPTLKWRG
jgi:hypothetical protein